MSKTWVVSPHFSDDLVEQLLFNRGIKTEEERQKFFNPKLSDYEKELKLPGIKTAKERILKAVEKKELIIVYGDYDVDGVCGTAILYHGLTSLGAKVLPYIPHREKEGYGLSEIGLKDAKDKGASLVITVDHGIVALEQAKLAKKLGLDLIITDHHTSLEEKPDCISIIHSTKMCGAAVGWCLVRELVSEEESGDLLDLVAIATVGDLLPLKGINRSLVKKGLEILNQTKRVGLKALFLESKLKMGEITAYHIGHILGPRLNAIGRLEHAIDSLRLLCTKDIEKARKLAALLTSANDQKKQLTSDAILEAKEMINLFHIGCGIKKKVLVLHSQNWIPGIIGLIAGRIADEYHVPTIAISIGATQSKGSARSVIGVDIVETIRKFSDILLEVGGHPKAAGFTIKTEKIEDFKLRLDKEFETLEFEIDEQLPIEAEISSKQLSKKLVNDLEKFEPCGVDNPRPLLASKAMRISDIRTVGGGQHLKFKSEGIDSIAFSFGNLAALLKEGQLVDVAYYLEIDQFNGFEKLQLKVVDIKL